ncbi:MAG: hypothetical protein J7M30_17260 [Deltaproteobacteria bacterium]|nr:hypothetical protein [Deltaproteobacteria bacterium]
MEEILTKAHDEMVQRMEELIEVDTQLQRKIKERKDQRNVTETVEQTGGISPSANGQSKSCNITLISRDW